MLQTTLKQLIESGEEEPINYPLPDKNAPRIGKKKKLQKGREFRMDAQIDGYDVRDVMLDLGSNVHILPNKSWESMGRPRLVYSPIQLWLDNQYKIYLIGRLENVKVSLANVKTIAHFLVIYILDESDPYSALLGIEWTNDNDAAINLKRGEMSFEADGIQVI